MTSPHDVGNFAGQTSQLPGIQLVPGGFREDSRPKLDNDALPFIRHMKRVYIVAS